MGNYINLQQLKAVIDPDHDVDFSAVDDANLDLAIDAAELWVDAITGAHWAGQVQTRTYTARFADILWIDDLLSVTTLKTDDDADGVYETEWTTDDYRPKPANATLDGHAYRWIEVTSWGDYAFPINLDQGVQIAGTFGASTAAPATIQQATLLVAHRLWLRHQHIFGRGNTSAQLAMTYIRADDDVVELLTHEYLRYIHPDG